MIARKIIALGLICLAQAPEFEVLGKSYTCPSEEIPDLGSLDARIRVDHHVDDACGIFYKDIPLPNTILGYFSEDSVNTLLIAECILTSHKPGYRVDIGRGVVIIISDIIFTHRPGPYLFEHLDRLSIDVFKVTINKLECDLFKIDRSGKKLLPLPKFSAQLRSLLFGIQDKLSQVEYEEHEALTALTYLLVELALKESGSLFIEHTLDDLKGNKELAERFRPQGSKPFQPEAEFTSVVV